MPSSKNYVRDYAQERKTAESRGETGQGRDSEDATRHRARRKALKLGMVKPGQDLDHKTPLSKGGTNAVSNFRAESPHDNRSFPRDSSGALVANHPKKK